MDRRETGSSGCGWDPGNREKIEENPGAQIPIVVKASNGFKKRNILLCDELLSASLESEARFEVDANRLLNRFPVGFRDIDEDSIHIKDENI